jgi:hypothetical protein
MMPIVIDMRAAGIAAAAGLALMALSLAGCAHENYGRYDQPGYDYDSNVRFGNEDWRFNRGRDRDEERNHWYY